jgi:large subunit ribosomal protein L15
MRVQDLSPPEGSTKKRKRVGRGPGSGHGKTSCRGHKGEKARSGGSIAPGFEGGQMPLTRRLPKRGFTNIFKKSYAIVNLKDLSRLGQRDVIDIETLKDAGLVKKIQDGVKVLGEGEITYPLVLKANRVSKTAKSKIEGAGGKVEILC